MDYDTKDPAQSTSEYFATLIRAAWVELAADPTPLQYKMNASELRIMRSAKSYLERQARHTDPNFVETSLHDLGNGVVELRKLTFTQQVRRQNRKPRATKGSIAELAYAITTTLQAVGNGASMTLTVPDEAGTAKLKEVLFRSLSGNLDYRIAWDNKTATITREALLATLPDVEDPSRYIIPIKRDDVLDDAKPAWDGVDLNDW
jgi:hypothetical protein